MVLALQSLTWQWFFDNRLRFGLNAPCESAHISLTLSARFTQRTGVFVVVLVALALAGSLGIVPASLMMLSAMLYLPVMMSVTQFRLHF